MEWGGLSRQRAEGQESKAEHFGRHIRKSIF
jgi:hypothetical protein